MTDKGDASTVRRPRRHVDRSLAAVDVGDDLRIAAIDGHHAQVNVLVERMLVRRNCMVPVLAELK